MGELTHERLKALHETIRDIQVRNAATDPDELERMIDEEVGEARRSFWTEGRR